MVICLLAFASTVQLFQAQLFSCSKQAPICADTTEEQRGKASPTPILSPKMVRFFLLAAIVLQLVVGSLQAEDPKLDIRQRLGENSQVNINDQINREYRTMYMYETMASYFGRPNVALPGFKKFFRKAADEEREHAHKLIDYLNKRGGQIFMKPIHPNIRYEWNSTMEATKQALEAEMDITKNWYSLRDKADYDTDTQLVDFIESEFLSKQVDEISELRALIGKLERAGSGLGEYMVDRELN